MKPGEAAGRRKLLVTIATGHAGTGTAGAGPLHGLAFEPFVADAVHLQRIDVRTTAFVLLENVARARVGKLFFVAEQPGEAGGDFPVGPRVARWRHGGL